MYDTISKLLSLLSRKDRRRMAFLLVFMGLTAVIETLGIASIIPLIGAMFQSGDEGPTILRWLRGTVLAGLDRNQSLIVISIGFALLQIIKNLAVLANTFAINRFIQGNIARNVQRVFSGYLNRPYQDLTKINSAIVLYDVFSTTSLAFDTMRVLLQLILEILLVTVAISLLLLVEPVISLITGASFALMSVIYYNAMSERVRRWGTAKHHHEGLIFQTIKESITSIKVVKIHNCQRLMETQLLGHITPWADITCFNMTANQLARAFVETMVVLGIFAIVIFTLGGAETQNETLSTLGLFGMAALRLMPSMNRILTNTTVLKERTVVVNKACANLTTVPENSHVMQPGTPLVIRQNIELRDLSFSYGGIDAPPTLDNIFATVPVGSSLGIVGPSGSGKTTLMDVMLGLLTATGGQMLVDGRDALGADLLPSWQASIGYVPQHIVILDDTLRRNVAFGIEDSEIDDERVHRALDMANVSAIIASLPLGLDTRMGESGVRLSGGQRQRVGIARALYRDPAVLMFDEATSALDNETERDVTAAIESLIGSKTLIVIAHRMSTVRNCSSILFMREGRVVDRGSFDELVARCPDFREFSTELKELKELKPQAVCE